MTPMQKLFNIEVSDVIIMILAIPAVMFLNGGEMNAAGLIGILIGNRLHALYNK